MITPIIDSTRNYLSTGFSPNGKLDNYVVILTILTVVSSIIAAVSRTGVFLTIASVSAVYLLMKISFNNHEHRTLRSEESTNNNTEINKETNKTEHKEETNKIDDSNKNNNKEITKLYLNMYYPVMATDSDYKMKTLVKNIKSLFPKIEEVKNLIDICKFNNSLIIDIRNFDQRMDLRSLKEKNIGKENNNKIFYIFFSTNPHANKSAVVDKVEFEPGYFNYVCGHYVSP